MHGGQKCKHCDKRFPAGWALKNHIALVHEKKKPHICHKCGEGFSAKSSMVNHIFDSHKEEELPNIYECFKICKQSFPAPKGLSMFNYPVTIQGVSVWHYIIKLLCQ